MKSKTNLQSIAILVGVFILGLLLVTVFTLQGFSRFIVEAEPPTPATKQAEPTMREPTASATDEPPEFIAGVYPPPGATISIEEYTNRRRGLGEAIVIGIWPDKIGITGLYPDTLRYMMSLYVDDAKIPQNTFGVSQEIPEIGVPFSEYEIDLFWSPELDPGEHSVKFRVVKSKDFLDYEWSFTIVEEK